jgi:hypothetical protein
LAKAGRLGQAEGKEKVRPFCLCVVTAKSKGRHKLLAFCLCVFCLCVAVVKSKGAKSKAKGQSTYAPRRAIAQQARALRISKGSKGTSILINFI